MLVPVAAAVVAFFVFYSFLQSRKVPIGQHQDKAKNRLVAFVLALVVLAVMWWLLLFLASRGVLSGATLFLSR